MSNVIAIVGRPNVGKSTFFNRMIGERKAIIDDLSGVTRDRIYGFSDWNGKNFTIVDTGGFVKNSDDVFEAAIRSQVTLAIDEAEAIVFIVDVTTGITDLDEEVARMLRKTKKPVFLAVNKVDNSQRHLQANEFWSLGFDNTYFISAITGGGTGELLDGVAELIPDAPESNMESDIPRIAIVGQPNVGKSSLTNALLGEERNIVTDIPGTTRDAIHTRYTKFDKDFYLIDTAGLRKKAKVHEDLEYYSVIRAVKAMDDTDVCVLMINAVDGLEAQDLAILGLIQRRKKGVVILVNKWDLVENKETNSARDFEIELKRKIAPFNDIPVLFTSVTEKQRIFQAVDAALGVWQNRQQKITTSKLNEIMGTIIERKPPPSVKGRIISIKYITQLPLFYPAFAFFCNHPKLVPESYKNFLENQMRERFDFSGVPISIYFREK
ncbi:ribosome biogenesis GTPase Der [Saprospiraceae bacterium]|nr:ribosome biogenesis GTPase Der [Saprospiraceae bacterium]MDB4163042.1 ribosome biogenesis GTPase Der [Saprospiraceae bacterium]